MKPPPLAEVNSAAGKRKFNPMPWVLGAVAAGLVVLGMVVLKSIPKGVFTEQNKEQRKCLARLSDQAMGLQLYASNYDDTLPKSQWMDSIAPFIAPVSEVKEASNRSLRTFHCPAIRYEDFGYGLNQAVVGANTKSLDQEHTVLTFDCGKPGKNVIAPTTRVLKNGRHEGKNNFSFLDGHVESLPAPGLLSKR